MSESIQILENVSKEEQYKNIVSQFKFLIEGEKNEISNMANFCALLKEVFNPLWVGFYIIEDQELVLGPFQGPIACTRIAFGKGVCGRAWQENKIIIVDDVDLFPGHIACSSLSKSEIVLPFYFKDKIMGVLDLDSINIAEFDQIDHFYLNELLKIMESNRFNH